MFFPADAPAERGSTQLRALRFSMNAPVVAVEGLPIGPARAAVALHRGRPEEARVTVALRSDRTGQVLFYTADDELGELRSASVVLDAALSFAESMGFLFDDDEVESRGPGGPELAAEAWARFIDEAPARPAPAVTPAPPPRSAERSPPAASAAPPPRPAGARSRAASPERPSAPGQGPQALDPLGATPPLDLLEVDPPSAAPLTMLAEEEPRESLPFWLLQPEPPRHQAPPPPASRRDAAEGAPEPTSSPRANPPRGPSSTQPDAPQADPGLGLERSASVPARARTQVPRPVPDREAVSPPQARVVRPQPRRAAEPAAELGRKSEDLPAPRAETPAGLEAVLAETGVDRLWSRSEPPRSTRPAEPPAPAPRSSVRPAAAAAAEAPAAPKPATLSKFRWSPEAGPGAVPGLPEADPEPDTGRAERREFDSLSLRLRSRF